MNEHTHLNGVKLGLMFPGLDAAEDILRTLLDCPDLIPYDAGNPPWEWKIWADSLLLYTGRKCCELDTDSEGRDMVACCGAALMHLRLALRRLGYGGNIAYFPDPHNSRLLAKIELGERQWAVPDENLLFDDVMNRSAWRGSFQQREVSSSILAALTHEVAREGAWLHAVEDSSERGDIVDLIAEGSGFQWYNREFRPESTKWVRSRERCEGTVVPAGAFRMNSLDSCLTPLAMRVVDKGEFKDCDDWVQAGCAPILAVIGTASDARHQWLRAGVALARMLLRAGTFGLSASFFNQPVDVPAIRPRLRQIIGRCGHPQLVFRLGYATLKAGKLPSCYSRNSAIKCVIPPISTNHAAASNTESWNPAQPTPFG